MLFLSYLVHKNSITKSVLLVAVLFATVIRFSFQLNCGYKKQYRMIPTMIDLKPAEVAAKEVSVSDQMECNTMCYYDVMCLAFVFSKNDRMCSTYHRSFNAMAYATKMGTTSYGKTFTIPM